MFYHFQHIPTMLPSSSWPHLLSFSLYRYHEYNVLFMIMSTKNSTRGDKFCREIHCTRLGVVCSMPRNIYIIEMLHFQLCRSGKVMEHEMDKIHGNSLFIFFYHLLVLYIVQYSLCHRLDLYLGQLSNQYISTIVTFKTPQISKTSHSSCFLLQPHLQLISKLLC